VPLVLRHATRADIAAYSDMADKPTIKAMVGDLDGRLLGIGGMAFIDGRWFAFCDVTEEGRAYKRAIIKAALDVMRDAARDGVKYIYADPDPKEPGAIPWMERFGFRPDPRSSRLYRWSAKEWQP